MTSNYGVRLIFGLAAVLALASTTSSLAQPQATIVSRLPNGTVLRSGAEIHLRTRTELNSQTNHVGDRFELEVSDPVMLNGQVVIPAGSVATGEVTSVRRRGMWGRRGLLETRFLFLRVDDRQIRITGSGNGAGHTGTGGVAAAVLTVPVVGFLVTGTSAVIPPQTLMVAYLNEDIEVAFSPAR